MRGLRTAVLAAAGVSGAVTLTAALLPQKHFASQPPLLHVALETAASLIVLLADFLVFARLLRHGRLNDLVLSCALTVFALTNLFLLMMPALVESLAGDLTVPALQTARVLGAVLFAVASFAPHRRVRRPGLVLAAWVVGASAAALLTAALVSVVTGHLVHHFGVTPELNSLAWPRLDNSLAPLKLQLAMAVLYGIAAYGFFQHSQRLCDEFLGWFASAAILAAFSHLNYFLRPSPYFQGVYVGDVFRLCSYAILLLGLMREIWSYWKGLSERAVVDERQRIARDLHDGLAQELACLVRNLDSLDDESREERAGTIARLRDAIERAQLESHRAISVRASPHIEPVEVALAEAATSVADRFHLGLELDLVPGVKLSAAREDALTRIACEAVTNAGRHSGAGQVNLKLERDGSHLRLRVSDQGCGFDTSVVSGFGLVSMGERARAVGGELQISSVPGGGSVVEVVL
jgi:signal transduction histidine kinase